MVVGAVLVEAEYITITDSFSTKLLGLSAQYLFVYFLVAIVSLPCLVIVKLLLIVSQQSYKICLHSIEMSK